MINFIKSDFINDIYQNVITRTFPLLQSSHKRILLDYLINMLNIIAYSFNFDFNRSKIYEYQFKQNNYQDLVALLLLLLPFINDDRNTKKQTVTSLNDIFTVKVNPRVDINKDKPIYLYSNLQYGRCARVEDNVQEIQYRKEYLDHNYYLLLNTIRSVSNKLYVNWIDVLPYDIGTFKSTRLYADTLQRFEKGGLGNWDPASESQLNEQIVEKLSGLCMDDIYDSIYNELFLNIFKIKWIIYDVIPLNLNILEPVPMLIVCNYLFDLDMAVNNYKWDTVTDLLREKFTNEWKGFITLLFSNQDYISDVISLDNISLQKIGRSLLYSFDKDYKGKHKAIENKEYIPFNPKDLGGEGIDLDKIEDQDISISSVEKHSLETLHPKHMYEYIRVCIQKFKHTWYYRHIFDQNTLSIKKIEQYKSLDSGKEDTANITLTLKNIYNYAKSLTHFPARVGGEERYLPFPQYWRSMNGNQRTRVLNRLNDDIEPVSSWFNIMRYIGRTYGRGNLSAINDKIHELARRNLIQVIFESLIMRGVLSYFEPFRGITDENIITSNKTKNFEQIKKDIEDTLSRSTLKKGNNLWNSSYYYLTGTPYSRMEDFSLESDKNKLVNYFEYSAGDQWFSAYAMNWISQIGFFHKYLNNRIIFVTGSTGVGKSTQVPKLLLYALKAVDYKNTGSVVCTQPRRAPTEKNAKTVSSQLGIPVHDKKYYYVQFKHKNEDYTDDVDHLSLKFITDGSLLQEIQNPVLKNIIHSKGTRGDYYTLQNQYDVVIVDEAHEHNKNMDIILTLMKFVTYYNNDIKLVIVSATMDDDEPVYRRYYRDINDNRMYPLNSYIVENSLDRINVDRRFHISPPGKTTTHKIAEYYDPKMDPINLIKKIVTEDPVGYVLYFQPGIMEINEEIQKLNKVLPPNVIAVPFHSKLNSFQREIVENIDDQLRNIKIDRSIPFSEFDEITNSKGTSHYDRVVIVATNIAEASLTIRNLKYVVDTGTQKTAIYDFTRGGTALIQKPISDSSRLQRRGRVGRTGPGTVYYMYPEGTTEGIRTQYDIAISNIYLELYDRLFDTYLEEPIFTNKNDPNIPGISLTFNSLGSLYDVPPIKGLSGMMGNQYFINEVFYNYIGNPNHYDYQNSQQYFFKLPNVYPNGFSLETLTDDIGKFYIVHPEELYIRRNILGEIVGLEPEAKNIKYNNKRILSGKMISFWRILLDNLFMSSYNLNGEQYVIKTELGKGISSIKQELGAISIEDFDVRFVYVLLYGMSLGIGEQMVKLISMYMATMNDFINAVVGRMVNNKFRLDIDGLMKFVGKQKSDSDAALYVLNSFHSMLEDNNISLNQNNIEFIEKLAILKYNFYNSKSSLDEKISSDITEQITKGNMQNSEKLSEKDIETMRNKNITRRLIIQTIKGTDFVSKWAEGRSIKESVMMTYLDRYLTFQNIIYSNEKELSRSYKKVKISDLVPLLKTAVTDMVDDKDKTTLAIMYGFKSQIIKKMVDNYYLSIYEPTIENIYSLKKIAPHIWRTMVDKRYLQNYVLYINADIEENTVLGLHYININLMKYVGYVYSQDMIYNKCNKYLGSSIKLEPGLKHTNIMAVSIYKKTLNEIMYDIIGSHDPDIWFKLFIIFKDQRYLQIRRFHDINYMTVREFSLLEGEFTKPKYPSQSGGSQPSVEQYQMDLNLLKYLFKKFEK